MARAPVGTRVRGAGVLGCVENHGKWVWRPRPPPSSPSPQGPEVGAGGACRTTGQRGGPGRPRRTPLAVLARVAIGAGTAVLVRLRVDACAPVGTGVVAAAVVQVWGRGCALREQTEPLAPSLPEAPTWGLATRPSPTRRTFVAEQAAPVGLAAALPGLHTAAVHAARVRDALVAESPLPAIAAPGESRGPRGHVCNSGPRELWPLPGWPGDTGAESHGPPRAGSLSL